MYREWTLDPSARQVRSDAPIKAPCGCAGKGQRAAYLGYPHDHSPGFIECVGCGATWGDNEGDTWEYFGDE
jgi:hypothetical protein